MIVALPLAPCAFVSSVCNQHSATSEADVPAKSCCAEHSAPAEKPANGGEQPCGGDCCRLSPFVKSAVKVSFDAPALLTAVVLPQIDVPAIRPLERSSLPMAAAISLQILHCQWRC